MSKDHPTSAAPEVPLGLCSVLSGDGDALRAGNVGLALVDGEGTIHWWDPACRVLFGDPVADMDVGLPAILRAVGLDEGCVRQIHEQLLHGAPFDMACRYSAEPGNNELRIKGSGAHTANEPMLIRMELVSERQSDDWKMPGIPRGYLDALLGSVDAAWEWDFEHSRVIWSSGLDRLMGLPSSEIKEDGSHWSGRLDEATLAKIGELVGEMSAGRRNGYELEYKVRTKGQEGVWVRDRCAVLEWGQDGRPRRTFGVITDIDRIKRAEQESAKWKTRLSTLIDNLGVGVVLENADRRIILADRTYCGYLGLRPDEVVGRSVREVLSAPKVMSLFNDLDGFLRSARTCIVAGQRVVGERFELSDGRVFERDYTPVWLDGGQVTSHLWVYREITDRLALQAERGRQEERFRQLIDNMGMGRMEVDPGFRVLDVNEHLCGWVGTTREEVLGSIADQLPSVAHLGDVLHRKMEERASDLSDSFELTVHHRDGSLRYLHVSGTPRFDSAGNFLGTVAVLVDLTERRQMEDRLRITGEEALSALKAKELFLANMGHELRTPLNAIIGLGGEVLRSLEDPDSQRHMDVVLRAARDLRDLVNDILQQARAGSDAIELQSGELDVRALVGHVRSINARAAQDAGIRLEARVSPQVVARHVGDARRVQQVLLNIVGNAIKFTRQGRVDLSVDATSVKDDRQVLTFTVKDTGMGISADFLPHLFKPFSRDPALAGAAIEGSGLGLSICRHLLHHMDGTIAVDSTPGVGTTVRVELELGVMDVRVNAQNGPTETVTEPLPPGLRMLVVDDSPTNRAVLNAVLSGMGMHVDEASSGGEALVHLCSEPCDMLFLDLQMPDMSGQELLRIMRDVMRATPPTILVTAGDRDTIDQLQDIPDCKVLYKPFEREELLAAMDHCSRDRAMQASWDPARSPANELYDLRRLEELASGEELMVRRVLEAFVADVPLVADSFLEAARSGDVVGLVALAHRLKPSLLMFGQDALVDLIHGTRLPKGGSPPQRLLGLATVLAWRVRRIADDINGTRRSHGQ
jgi:PAS domain S-box-containing protein